MTERDAFVQRLDDNHRRMQTLLTTLAEQQLALPYHAGVNPPLWEAGHTAFFYETFVFAELDGLPSYDPSMDTLWDSFQVSHRDRWSGALFPGLQATLEYTDAVYRRMRERIAGETLDARSRYLYRYALAHQQMHIESMIWARQTVAYPMPEIDHRPCPPAQAVPGHDAEIPAGRWCIGAAHAKPAWEAAWFAFDNEKPGFVIEICRPLPSAGR